MEVAGRSLRAAGRIGPSLARMSAGDVSRAIRADTEGRKQAPGIHVLEFLGHRGISVVISAKAQRVILAPINSWSQGTDDGSRIRRPASGPAVPLWPGQVPSRDLAEYPYHAGLLPRHRRPAERPRSGLRVEPGSKPPPIEGGQLAWSRVRRRYAEVTSDEVGEPLLFQVVPPRWTA